MSGYRHSYWPLDADSDGYINGPCPSCKSERLAGETNSVTGVEWVTCLQCGKALPENPEISE